MGKIKINMLSSADKVAGQGVGSAYLEQVELVKEKLSDIFDVTINGGIKYDIMHHHTIDPINYIKMKLTKGVNVAYVHFLPDTLDGSIKLPRIFFGVFKKDLIEYGIDENKITYIPNYVSKDKFYLKSEKEIKEIKRRYSQ